MDVLLFGSNREAKADTRCRLSGDGADGRFCVRNCLVAITGDSNRGVDGPQSTWTGSRPSFQKSVPAEVYGRAFGFEGAMDTLGAIIGPAIALALVGIASLRHIFLISFLSGAITVYVAAVILRERPRARQAHKTLLPSIASLPRSFRRFVGTVTIFGLGNFAHTLLVLHTVAVLTPSRGSVAAQRIGLGLYLLHNVLCAAVSYPVGALGDHLNERSLICAQVSWLDFYGVTFRRPPGFSTAPYSR